MRVISSPNVSLIVTAPMTSLVSTFTQLTDAIPSYAGHAGKAITVNPTATGLTVGSFEPVLTKGDLIGSPSAVLSISGGTNAVIGTGATITIPPADSTHHGYLTSADWTTFNAKQAPLALGNLTAGSTKIAVGGTGAGAVVGAGATIDVNESNLTHNNLGGLTTGDPHTQYLLTNGSRGLSANWDVGSYDLRAQTLTADGLTSGSVLFAGTNGLLSQDNANLYWDNINKYLGLGLSPVCKLHVYSATGRSIVATTSNSTLPTTLAASVPLAGIFTGSGSPVLQLIAASGSGYASDVVRVEAYRPASTAYNFFRGIADADGTPSDVYTLRGDGYMGVNISPSFNLHIAAVGGSGQTSLALEAYGADPNYPVFYGRRAEGTQAAPSAVILGDKLFLLAGRGYGATGWPTGSQAAIFMVAAENHTDTAKGTYISYEVCPVGSATRIEAMRVTGTGTGFGTTTPDAQVEIQTTPTYGAQALTIDQDDTDQAFIDFQGTGASDVSTHLTTRTVSTIAGHLKIEINGSPVWLAYRNEPTA